jgi:acetyl-CoA synthetase
MPFNLAQIICSKHQDAIFRIAIEEVRCSGTNTYTFGGLDYLSDKFATVLQNYGIKQGDVIAVILPSSAAFVVAHFAILKLGAIVAPFNPQLPVDLLESLIKQCQSKALVIDETLFSESKQPVIDSLNLQVFVASDYVSKNDFGNRGKGFWREINFADADFKLAATDEKTPAYRIIKQDENNYFTASILTHGFIAEGLQNNKQSHDFIFNEDKSVQIPGDWSSKNILFDLLYPAWFSGYSVIADVAVK